MFSRFVKWFASWLPSTTIIVDGKPYLTRHYVLLRDWKWFNIYVHHFHASDQGDELHNHPWKWAVSFVFDGGYREEFRVGDYVAAKYVFPGNINVVKHTGFHRVDMLDEEKGAWSVFFAGPRITTRPEWGFWNRHTKEFRDWRENPNAIP